MDTACDILVDISDRQRRLSQSTRRRTSLDACEYADFEMEIVIFLNL